MSLLSESFQAALTWVTDLFRSLSNVLASLGAGVYVLAALILLTTVAAVLVPRRHH